MNEGDGKRHLTYRRIPNNLVIRICSALAAFFGVAALLGWGFGLPVQEIYGEGRIPMAPSTAALFLLYGSAVYLRTLTPSRALVRRIGPLIILFGALVASVLLVLALLRIPPLAEKLGFSAPGNTDDVVTGHMSPITAVGFLLASFSYLAALPRLTWSWRRPVLAALLATFLTATATVHLLAYTYETPLFRFASFLPPALTTSAAFVTLGIAMVALTVPQTRPRNAPVRPVIRISIAFLLVCAGIVAAGYLYTQNYERHYRAQIEHELSSVADLKVIELLQWRKERLGDAAVAFKNGSFSALVRRYLESEDEARTAAPLRGWLSQVQVAYEYDRILLIDSKGQLRMSVPEAVTPIAKIESERALEIMKTGEVDFQDFYRNEHDQRIYLSVVVPILTLEGGSTPVGAIAMRIAPERVLYPLIQRWPTPNRTAETFLIRRDGETALFLNELRFRRNTALNLSNSLQNAQSPAVRAALGHEGVLEGIGYRGEAVIAVARAVPQSPWFLIAQTAASELYSPIRERLWVIVTFIGVVILGAAAGVSLIWREQRLRYYQSRYKTSEKLRASERRYRTTLDSMLEGCQIIGPDWRYLYVNDAAAAHAQRAKEDLLGKTMMECFPGIERTEMFAALERCMSGRTALRMENEFANSNGSRHWFELGVQPAPEGLFVLSIDISARRRAEEKLRELNAELERRVVQRTAQLEAANAELESFSYSVSHDLRAPLRGIDGWSLALIEDCHDSLDGTGREYLNRVRTETQRMGQLIDDMLQLAQITRVEMRSSTVDLSAIARDILARLEESQPERQVKIVIQPNLTAQGDSRLFEALLANLLGNAFKFTGKRVDASIEFGQTPSRGELAFFVRDNGAGFDMAYASKLFGAFQRMHKASDFPGTGVGLAIVQRIVHRHGGSIWVETAVGQGATFYFTLKETE